MHKLLFLVSGADGASVDGASFAEQARRQLAPRLLELAPAGLKLSVSDPSLPRAFSMPMRRDPLALVSVWSERAEAAPWREVASSLRLDLHGYRVEESAPRRYPRHWPDGEPSPGVCLLTLFRRRARLDQPEFLRRWHQGHSPMALRTHPLWGYLRNVVHEPLTEGAPPWAGIVEEHFREASDLTDPRRFFGGTLRLVPNALHVLAQTSTFLDLFTLRNYMLVEHWLRTPPSAE